MTIGLYRWRQNLQRGELEEKQELSRMHQTHYMVLQIQLLSSRQHGRNINRPDSNHKHLFPHRYHLQDPQEITELPLS